MPTSPDLNVFEKIWRAMKQRVESRGAARSLAELKQWIRLGRDAVDQDMITGTLMIC
jgi:transposase